MQLLYEEDGDLKVGAVLGESTASFQVESPHGRRSKIKAANVLLAFERPSGAELLAEADKFAQDLDIGFLWECSGSREFGFRDLAKDYVGREPTAVEAAGVLIKLHSAPMYFYRRGKGRFQAAPLETLKLALAAVEKRKRVQESIAAWAERLARFDCPPEVAGLKEELLYSPDRNKAEAKALEQACKQTGLTPARLFERCGLLPDAHEYHLQRFVHEFFPRGVRFPAHDLPSPPNGLPLAEVRAFSLDDVGTSEIDDAFSLQRTGEMLPVGIHIAAPGLAFGPGSPPGASARDARPDWRLGARYPRLERVPVAANLRHAHYDRLNELFESGGRAGLAYEEDLHALWQIALALEASRGRPSAGAIALDYSFHVEDGRVRIVPRKRGAPLDKLVSEMMILAHTSWGVLLAERDVAGIYRVQSTGKVRLSVHPEPHEGLGVACYAWMSSPLRRYVDLVNQWQLGAAIAGRRAPFARNSEALLAALRAFEVTYARYDEHQRAMETYWVLRWLEQEAIRSLEGVVLRENLVRMEGAPLVTRVPSLPVLDPGTRGRLEVGQMDFLERSVSLTYRETLGTATASVADDLLPLG